MFHFRLDESILGLQQAVPAELDADSSCRFRIVRFCVPDDCEYEAGLRCGIILLRGFSGEFPYRASRPNRVFLECLGVFFHCLH